MRVRCSARFCRLSERIKTCTGATAQQNEDDFSWDVEEEEAESPKEAKPVVVAAEQPVATSPTTATSAAPSTKLDSGRNSSEEGTAMSTSSYDVVSRKVSEDEKAAKEEDEDSDWE